MQRAHISRRGWRSRFRLHDSRFSCSGPHTTTRGAYAPAVLGDLAAAERHRMQGPPAAFAFPRVTCSAFFRTVWAGAPYAIGTVENGDASRICILKINRGRVQPPLVRGHGRYFVAPCYAPGLVCGQPTGLLHPPISVPMPVLPSPLPSAQGEASAALRIGTRRTGTPLECNKD